MMGFATDFVRESRIDSAMRKAQRDRLPTYWAMMELVTFSLSFAIHHCVYQEIFTLNITK